MYELQKLIFVGLLMGYASTQFLDPCSSSPCANMAKCVPLNEYNYTCECRSNSWSGRLCTEPTTSNPCFSRPCRMNSSCLFDEAFDSFKCVCQPGYTGVQCDQIIDVCQSVPCKNRGICSNINNKGVVQANYYQCSCRPGFMGENCQIVINQCASNPCLNFGICISRIDRYECICLPSYNGTRCENDFSLNRHTCKCPPGFFGDKCEIELNQCALGTNPCGDNGVCTQTPNNGQPFSCICLPGFTGLNCQIQLDLCANNPCQFGGTCTTPTPFQYQCECPAGTRGLDCEENIDECLSQPCKNNGTCIETALNSYTCLCPERFLGLNCEIVSHACKPDSCFNGALCINLQNGPFCLCLDGFTGTKCEISSSACNSEPCLNNGTCIMGLNNTYRCACRPPYTGFNCQSIFDQCSLHNPCTNGASCNSSLGQIICNCLANSTGRYCEQRVSVCESEPCGNNGKCYEQANGSYRCFCNRGFTGQNCSTSIDACLSNPCRNGAMCETLINDYRCECPVGYTSKRCEVEVYSCESNPCQNGGICFNSFNFYNCSCLPDFTGRNCEISLDPCIFKNDCSSNGVCENRFGIGVCICNQPFYGEFCQFSFDYCLSRPCQNAGNCQSNSTSYSCTCTAGFTGDNCELVIDPCENYCLNGGSCFMDAKLMIGCQCPCGFEGLRCEKKINFCNTSSLCKFGKCIESDCGYTCDCECGYTGRFCDVPLDQCLPNADGSPKCLNNGLCINNGCDFSCNCTQGFTGRICQIKRNLCEINTCLNEGICNELTNDFFCSCPCKYYTGKTCQIYNDICLEKSNECLNGARCLSKGCDFECECSPFFTGSRCETKIDPCLNNPCFNDGICVSDDSKGSFNCICSTGFTGQDCSTLIVLSPCASSPCEIFELCLEMNGTFSCECPPLFTGQKCDIRRRICNNSPCNGGQCIEDLNSGSFRCNCPIGLTGDRCDSIIDLCLNSPCLNNAICSQSRPNSFNCMCPPGFTGTLCQLEINPCLSFPCLNNAICLTDPINPEKWACNCNSTCFRGEKCEIEINPCTNITCNSKGTCINMGSCNSKCLCQVGWTGENCETQLNICASQPCLNGGNCINNQNSWTCQCRPGFTGTRCTSQLLACSSSPCENGGLCTELNSFGYSCTCRPGWSGISCEIDINECESSPCLNSGTCIEDKIGSFKCICQSAFSGKLCETMIDICFSQPCLNSAVCVSNLNGTYTCICPGGYYGSRCEIESNECYSNPCLNQGICIDKVDGYECRCPPEFTGPNCNISSCTHYCLNGGLCIPGQSNSNLCICRSGFSGSRCEKIANPCDSNPCGSANTHCVSRFFGHFECLCKFGFTGRFCEFRIDPCTNNPCVRGNCFTNEFGLAKCFCPSGFTGRFCEINLSVCEPTNPCLNGGSCHFTTSYNISVCPVGVTGTECDMPIDVCASNPCRSRNAKCLKNALNSFQCICPPFETGRFCETTINLCQPNPCPSNIRCQQISFTQTKCICPPGFTGPKCTERYDVCQSNPCINGNCVSPLPGIYRCNCQPGFQGINCQESIVLCDLVTCLNGGFCIGNLSLASGFHCVCPNSFTGEYCQTPINPCESGVDLCGKNGICMYVAPGDFVCKCRNNCFFGKSCESTFNPCEENICKNNGLCTFNESQCSYMCQCLDGFGGQNCEFSINPCLTRGNPCLNGATCVINGTDDYYCQCGNNFSGRFCEKYIDPCFNRPCLNDGVCTIDSSFHQAKCICQYGYTGLDCSSRIDFCSKSPCFNNANCINLNTTFLCECKNGFGGKFCQEQIDTCSLLNPCANGDCYRTGPGNYTCFCVNGWTGRNCDTRISFCESNPCANGLCIDYIGGYSCQCSSGYTGFDCSSFVDLCLTNPCRNGICLSVLNQVTSNPEYLCLCDTGFTGPECDIPLNLCAENGGCINNSTCRQLSSSFAYCDCPTGYEGSKCEIVTNLCSQITCFNGGTCQFEGINKFSCNCLAGFNGTYCQIQTDACIPNPCKNSGNCSSIDGFYQCKCPSNFGGFNCQFSQTCDINPCQNSGLCSKLFDSIICECQPGFTGVFCDQIINACESNPCLNGASCLRFNFTGFLCACTAGFTGIRCNQDIDECALNVCKNNARCENTFGSFKCTCQPGFTGVDCSEIITNACLNNNCSRNGTQRCIQTSFGNFACVCNIGYSGRFCEEKVLPCQSSPCLNDGACINNPDSDSFSCICLPQFFGNRCEVSSDFCSAFRPCGPFGTCRSINSNDYECDCQPGIAGKNCEIIIDTCESNPCLNSGTCVPSINFYSCLCFPSHFGPNCEMPVDRCSEFPCFNNGTCIAIFNNTRCQCQLGFTGLQCEFRQQCLIECKNGGLCNSTGNGCICPNNFNGNDCSNVISQCLFNPCKNGAQCKDNSNGYSCNCTSGFTGQNCDMKITPCDSNPCSENGICESINSSNYTCRCFYPFSGKNCETRLTLCNFINCGQGNCKPSLNDSFSATCECLPGFTGQFCNIRIQGCLFSPCQNGATCVEGPNGTYTCNCTPEFNGPNCEIRKFCVDTFDYCSSLPCLNGGTCNEKPNCTITCNCSSDFHGDFCQFSRQAIIFSTRSSSNLVLPCETKVNFKMELQPCLTEAWKQENPHFSCPVGFEIIPGVDERCFLAKAIPTGVNKPTADYECQISGASLVIFETRQKFDSVLNWINLKQLGDNNYWISSAVSRNGTNNESGWSWVWASRLTNAIYSIDFDNWGAFQQRNFNGDSLYLNGIDNRFYVELSRNRLNGFICESKIKGLTDLNININELSQQTSFTNLGKSVVTINYSVDITTNDTSSVKNEARTPDSNLVKKIVRDICFKEVFIDNLDGRVYSFDNAFSIDVCGNIEPSHIDFIKQAIVDSWLTARPEFLWCSIQRNCLKIHILHTKEIFYNNWNKYTRLDYSVFVNDVLISSNDSSIVPSSDIMRQNIEKVRKNFYSNYLLCGIVERFGMIQSFIDSPGIKSQRFPLLLRNFALSTSIFSRSKIETSIRNAFYLTTGISPSLFPITIELIDNYQDVLVLSQFYSNIPVIRFNINPSQVVFPSTLMMFSIIINGNNFSPAVQALLNENQFYFAIQQQIFADSQLRSLGLTSFLLNENQRFFIPENNFWRVKLTTQVIEQDLRTIENVLKSFITNFKIQFKHCTNCWNDSISSFTVRHIFTNNLIDHKAKMFYEYWFVVVIKNQMENNRLKIVDLSEESDFNSKTEMNKQAIYNSLNSIPVSYNNGNRFYRIVQNNIKTRSIAKAVTIDLSQSILHEDIEPIVNGLKSTIGLVSNSKTKNQKNFEIDYWGQKEYIKRTASLTFDTYWKTFFFIRPENDTNDIFNPTYDFLINNINLNNFFRVYRSARSNLFVNTITTDPRSDFSSSHDLFYLPCYGSVNIENQILISFLLRNAWLNLYSDEQIIKDTLQIEILETLTIPYVNAKGSFSVIPYAVRAFNENFLLKRGLYKEPSLNELIRAMSGVCNVQDSIENLFREDSLNYIKVVGTISLEQAKQYLPTVTFAYMSYFLKMNQKYEPNVLITKPTEIISIENYLVNMMIVTKIYYRIFANTTFEMNLVNYDIKNTQFRITSPDLNALTSVLSRKMTKSFARIDLLRSSSRIENINLILAWLPKITIEMEFGRELSLEEKRSIENVLVDYWNESLKKSNYSFQIIEVELAYSRGYYNLNTESHSVQIYYIISIDGLVKYESELPGSLTDMSPKLDKIGFKTVNRELYCRVRSVFVDTNERPVEFNHEMLTLILQQSWNEYIKSSDFFLLQSEALNINAKVVKQSIYYVNEKQVIGINYAVSVDGRDPFDFLISDLPFVFLQPKINPFRIISNSSLLARRMYVYSGRLKDEMQIINPAVMKEKISNLWKEKNIKSSNLQTNVVYRTSHYKAESRNFYSNFLDVSFYRITYTQSINGIEPSHLFYQSPIETDFDRKFLNYMNQNLMGFCFKGCFNYKQSGILIKPEYAAKHNLLDLIKNTWIKANRIESNLLNPNNIQLTYITNKRSFKSMDNQTGLSIVLFNAKLNSRFNQIDSLDLKEPTKEDYLKELASVYVDITPKDLYPILDLSVIKETKQTTSLPTKHSEPQIEITKTTTLKDLKKDKSSNLEWWGIFLIILGVLLFLTVVILSLIIISFIRRNNKFVHKSKKHLLRNDTNSEFSSRDIQEPQDFDEDFNYNRSVINQNISIVEPNFTQTISKSAINRQSEKIVYPGLTIEEIVPNPIYTKIKTDEILVSNIYLTGNMIESESTSSSSDKN